MKKIAYVIAGTLIATHAARTEAALINVTYLGPTGGSWSVAGNWSPAGMPNNGGGNTYQVLIDGSGANKVIVLNTSPTIESLQVDAGDELSFPNDADLTFSLGPITNNGVISMNSTANGTDLRIGADFPMTGSGVLLMGNHVNNIIRNNFGGVTRLTNGANHTIRGAGQVGINTMFFTNDGLVDATQPAMLQFDLRDEQTNVNTGILQASGGGMMNLLNSGTIDNIGGLIQALNASVVNVMGTTISGGDLDTAGSGVIHPSTNVPMFSNVTNLGLLQHSNDQDASYNGTITNEGVIHLETGGNGTDMRLNSLDTIFAGAGEILMSNGTNNIIRNNFGPVTRLVNESNHTIHGAGQIGINTLFLTNNGLIDATQSNALQFDLRDEQVNVNNGTLQASAGGTMNFLNCGNVDNTNGVIQALDNSVVNAINTAIVAGELHTEGSGVIHPSTSPPSFQDILLTGLLRHSNDEDAAYVGTIENDGTIELASTGNGTEVRLHTTPTTFTGKGDIAMGDHGNNIIRNNYGALTRLLNNSGHTIHGGGQIGVNTMFMTNEGLIDATTATPLQFDLREEETNFNTGTLQASGGGTMNFLNCGTVDNTDGVIQALTGSTVNVINTTIIAGELHTESTGVFHPSTSAPSLQNVVNSGLWQHLNDQDAAIIDSITNNGTMEMISTGNGTEIRAHSAITTFGGTGQVVMSNHVNNFIRNNFGAVTQLVNGAGHTIRGGGQIGLNTLNIVNQGSIIADQPVGISIDPREGGFSNQGLLRAATGSGIAIQPDPFTNAGSVVVDAGASLTRQQNYEQTAGSTAVNGTLTLASSGQLNLNGGSLSGNGLVTGGRVNNLGGSVEPGSSAGQLSFGAGYTQAPGGQLKIEIGGGAPATGHDVLVVTGNVTIGGVLNVSLINGFTPSPGQTFTFLTHTGTRTGFFCSVLPKGTWDVIYAANSIKVVSLGTGCPADVNASGAVNVDDLLAIINAWGACAAGCPTCIADIAPPQSNGVVDVDDLLAVINAWGACP